MPNTIDNLAIQINANAKSAYTAIDRLANKLDALGNSLGRVDVSKLDTISTSIGNLGTSMQGLWQTTKGADFTRLVSNLNKLASIDTVRLNATSTSIHALIASFANLGATSRTSGEILTLASNLSKLGSKGVEKAVTNIPLLAQALSNLITTLSTAPAVSQNVVDLTNALANLASQGRGMGSATNSLNLGFGRTTSSMKSVRHHSKSLASAFGKLYASYFLVIRGVKAFANAIENTADYLESFNYFTVSFNKIAKEWSGEYARYGYQNAEAYAESFTSRLNETLGKMSGLQLDESTNRIVESGLKNLGMNLTEMTQFASGIASITNAIGATGEVSVMASQSVTMLAADLGSLKNMDFADVSANLQSALMGQARAVYKYGIDVTQASLQTYAATLGIQKNVSEMTQSEKMQLRLLAILDQSKVAWGDLANTINSPSNMIRQFKNNISELGIVLGQMFIPLLTKVMPVINGVSIAIKRLLVDIAGILGITLDIDSFGQSTSDGLEEIEQDASDASDSLDKLNKGVRAFDELNVISTKSADTDTSSLADTIDLTTELKKASNEYQKVWNQAYEQMTNKAQEFADQVSSFLDPVKDLFEDFALGDFVSLGEDTGKLVLGIINFFNDALAEVPWEDIGTKIGTFLANIPWTDLLEATARAIYTGISGALKLYASAFDAAPIETAVITAIGVLKYTGLGSAIAKSLAKKIGDIEVVKEISEFFEKNGVSLAISGLMVAAGIVLQIDTIKKIENGHLDIMSLPTLLKEALGAALVALGSAWAINVITGAGMAASLEITVPIAIVGTLISLAWGANKAEENKELQDWLDKNAFGLMSKDIQYIVDNASAAVSAWESVKKQIEYDTTNFNGDWSRIQDMAEAYFTLSENYDNLTEEEKGLLLYYKGQLEQLVPGISEQINQITGAYEGTREELTKIIKLEQTRAKISAGENVLSSALTQQYQLEADKMEIDGAVEEAMTEYSNRKEYFNKYLQKYFDENVKGKGISFEQFSKAVLTAIDEGESSFKLGYWEDALGIIHEYKFKISDLGTNIKGAALAYIKATRDLYELQQSQTATAEALAEAEQTVVYWEGVLADSYLEVDKIEHPELYTDTDDTKDDETVEIKGRGYRVYATDNTTNNTNKGHNNSVFEQEEDVNTTAKANGETDAQSYIDGATSKLTEGKSDISDAKADLFGNNEEDKSTIQDKGYKTGKRYLKYIKNGLIDNAFLIDNAKIDLFSNNSDTKTQINEKGKLTGERYIKNIINGMSTLSSKVGTTVKNALLFNNWSSTDQKDFVTNCENVGSRTISKLVAGMNTTVMQQKIIDAFGEDWLNNSKNKTILENAGKALGDSIANGVSHSTIADMFGALGITSPGKTSGLGSGSGISGISKNSFNVSQYTPSVSTYTPSTATASSSLTALYDNLYSRVNSGTTDVNVTFSVEGDPTGIFKVVQEEAQQYTSRTGNYAFA